MKQGYTIFASYRGTGCSYFRNTASVSSCLGSNHGGGRTPPATSLRRGQQGRNCTDFAYFCVCIDPIPVLPSKLSPTCLLHLQKATHSTSRKKVK